MRKRRKNAQFLRPLVYDLKRDYGFPITIVKTVSTTVDLGSGIKSSVLASRRVERAIFLPARAFRSFVYDLSYVANNKNFTTGSFFDPTDRTMFIDARDVDDFEINADDRVLYNDEEYIVTEIHDFIAQVLFGVKMRHIKGQIRDYLVPIIEVITVTDLAAGEVS